VRDVYNKLSDDDKVKYVQTAGGIQIGSPAGTDKQDPFDQIDPALEGLNPAQLEILAAMETAGQDRTEAIEKVRAMSDEDIVAWQAENDAQPVDSEVSEILNRAGIPLDDPRFEGVIQPELAIEMLNDIESNWRGPKLEFNALDSEIVTDEPKAQEVVETGGQWAKVRQQALAEAAEEATDEAIEGQEATYVLRDQNGRPMLTLIGEQGSLQWAFAKSDGTPGDVLSPEYAESFIALFPNLEEMRIQSNRNIPTETLSIEDFNSKIQAGVDANRDPATASYFRRRGLTLREQQMEDIMKQRFGNDWEYSSWNIRELDDNSTPRGYYAFLERMEDKEFKNLHKDVVDASQFEDKDTLITKVQEAYQRANRNAAELTTEFLQNKTVQELDKDYKQYEQDYKEKEDAATVSGLRLQAQQMIGTLQSPLAPNATVDDTMQYARQLVLFNAKYLQATDINKKLIFDEKDQIRQIHAQLMGAVQQHPNFNGQQLIAELQLLHSDQPDSGLDELEDYVEKNEKALEEKRKTYQEFQDFVANTDLNTLFSDEYEDEIMPPIIQGITPEQQEAFNEYHINKLYAKEAESLREQYEAIEGGEKRLQEIQDKLKLTELRFLENKTFTQEQLDRAGLTKTERQEALNRPMPDEMPTFTDPETGETIEGIYSPELHAMVHPRFLEEHQRHIEDSPNNAVLYRNPGILATQVGDQTISPIIPLEGSPLEQSPSIMITDKGEIHHIPDNSTTPDMQLPLYPDEIKPSIMAHQLGLDMDNNAQGYYLDDQSINPIIPLNINEKGQYSAAPLENLGNNPIIQRNPVPEESSKGFDADPIGAAEGAAARFLQMLESRKWTPGEVAPNVMERASVMRSLKRITRDFLNTPLGLFNLNFGGLIPRSKTDIFIEGMNQYAQRRFDEQKFLESHKELISSVVNPQAQQDKRQQVTEHLNNILSPDDPRYQIVMTSLEDPKNVDRIHAQIANQGIADASKPPKEPEPIEQPTSSVEAFYQQYGGPLTGQTPQTTVQPSNVEEMDTPEPETVEPEQGRFAGL